MEVSQPTVARKRRLGTPALVGAALLLAGLLPAAALAALFFIPSPAAHVLRAPFYLYHLDRGKKFVRARDIGSAEREYDELVRLRPDYYGGYLHRGYARLELARYEEAIADCTQGLRLHPPVRSHAILLRNRGTAHRRRKEYAAALADLTEALRVNPAEHAPLHQRMLTYYDTGRAPEAIADAGRIILAECPEVHEAYWVRGTLLERGGDYRGAAEDLRRATEHAPRNVECWVARGWFEYEAGMLPRAIASDRHALKLNPGVPEARWNLGLCCLLAGREAEARAAFDAVRPITTPQGLKAQRQALADAQQRYPRSAALISKARRWMNGVAG